MLTQAPQGHPATVDPTLSVVLPNYNHASLIRRAVGALQAADRLPDEANMKLLLKPSRPKWWPFG